MHINNGEDLDRIIAAVVDLDAGELDRLQGAIDERRAALGSGSTVLERRGYRGGLLQLEKRGYRRRDGEITLRGPYWYFHFREGGKQKSIYIGKTEEPEATLDEKLVKE